MFFFILGCYLDCRDIKDKATIEKKCVFSGIYMIKPQRDMPAFKVHYMIDLSKLLMCVCVCVCVGIL